ncbi:hypothetical protein ACFXPV_30045 [Streptomyces sp. NPDC059118]
MNKTNRLILLDADPQVVGIVPHLTGTPFCRTGNRSGVARTRWATVGP